MFKINKTHLIHVILGHSYLLYFVLLCIGVFFDTVYPVKFLNSKLVGQIGLGLVFVGSVLMVWAQQSSKKSLHERHQEVRGPQAFFHGPYRLLKSPTQVGLMLMFIGLGLVLNSVFITVAAIISYILSKTFFIKKQQEVLLDRYGESYKVYRDKVKL